MRVPPNSPLFQYELDRLDDGAPRQNRSMLLVEGAEN